MFGTFTKTKQTDIVAEQNRTIRTEQKQSKSVLCSEQTETILPACPLYFVTKGNHFWRPPSLDHSARVARPSVVNAAKLCRLLETCLPAEGNNLSALVEVAIKMINYYLFIYYKK